MIPAEDAVVLDTSEMSIDQAVEAAIKLVTERSGQQPKP